MRVAAVSTGMSMAYPAAAMRVGVVGAGMSMAVATAVRVTVPTAVGMAVIATEDAHQDYVDENASARDEEHQPSVYYLLLWIFQKLLQPKDGLEDENARYHPDDKHRKQGTDGLSPAEAEAVFIGRFGPGEADRRDAHQEGGNVREQMCRIRHNR
jgi:hypothetical protein